MRQKCEICGEDILVARNVFSDLQRKLDVTPSPQGAVVYYAQDSSYSIPPIQGRVYPLYSFHVCHLPEENALETRMVTERL